MLEKFTEILEKRWMLSAVAPTDLEQLTVELVNRARANPVAEAARFGIDLNEGLDPGTISAAPKQPLAVNPYLTDSARRHSQWMIDHDVFSHTGEGGSDPGGRMAAAGYVFTPPWSWGENIAWRGTKPGTPEPVATTARLHQDLFVDLNYPERGHRTNLLAPDFKEMGAGVVAGEFQGYNAVMTTEDFAYSGTGSFLTGVAYTDAVNDDDFYTPGEGIGGVTISARRAGDGATFSTQSWASGGYSLKLPAGTYDVTGTGAALNGAVRFGNVVIGAQNVKRDFLPNAQPPAAAVVGRHVFYNNSVYDGATAAANAADDNAIATDKQPLLPGQTSGFANYTSHSRGLNGLMVDIANAAGDLTAADFAFAVGDGSGTWTAAPPPAAVVRRAGAGEAGSDRFTLTWPDGAILNRWLKVTVLADAHTGLASADEFYFGNLVGETGNSPTAAATVNAVDLGQVRANQLTANLAVTSRYDMNRDGRVNAVDLGIVRANQLRTLAVLAVPVPGRLPATADAPAAHELLINP